MKDQLIIPPEKLRTLDEVTERLRRVPNLAAFVLGGSHARGLARSDSDLDVGLYYREASPLCVDHVRPVAPRICTPGSVPTVTKPYEWGPWVNEVHGFRRLQVEWDFLYRNLDQVEAVIGEGRRGVWRHEILYSTSLREESHDGLDYAISLARQYQAQLTLLHIVEQDNPRLSNDQWLKPDYQLLRQLVSDEVFQ